MLIGLLLAFTLIPLLELWVLLLVGQRLGVGLTIALVVVTGLVGAVLAKSQGLLLLSRIREQLARGELPADELLHGLFVLAGGIFLLTPGLITDTLGFLFLLPPTRTWFKGCLQRELRKLLERGEVFFWRWR